MSSWGINKLNTIHPDRNMNIYTTFHGNPSDSFTQKYKCEPHGGARGNVRGHQRTVTVCTNLRGNPSHSCWDISVWIKRTNWQADINRATRLAWLKTSRRSRNTWGKASVQHFEHTDSQGIVDYAQHSVLLEGKNQLFYRGLLCLKNLCQIFYFSNVLGQRLLHANFPTVGMLVIP